MKRNQSPAKASAQKSRVADTRRKRATRPAMTLDERTKQLARLVEQGPLSLMITDTRGIIEYINARFTQITGYASADVVGKSIQMLASDDVPSQVYEQMWSTLTAGHEWRGELHARKKNGESYWISSVMTPLADAHDKVNKLLTLAEDITNRKQVEQALRTSEAKFRSLFENVPDGVYQTLPDGRLITANPALVKMLGYSSEQELLETGIAQRFYSDPAERANMIRALEQHGELHSAELTLTRKDGRRLIVLDNAHAVRDDEGRVLYFEGTLTDITERKHAEQATTRYANILNAVTFAAERFLRAGSWETQIAQVIEQLGQATRVSRVYIFQNLHEDDGTLYWHQLCEWTAPGISPQINNPALMHLPVVSAGFGRWIALMESGELIRSNVRDLPLSEQVELNAEEIKSIVCVPIFVRRAWWGFIGFDECVVEREWSLIEADALRAAADTLGAAIGREQVDNELFERARHLALLNQITRTALASPSLHDMLQTLADRLGELLRADSCYITLWDSTQQRVQPITVSGTSRDSSLVIEPVEVTMAESVLQAGHVLIAEDVFSSPYVSARISTQFPSKSMIGLPLIARSKKLGAAMIAFNQTHHFTEDEINRATQAVGQISLALANALSLESEQKRASELEALRQAGLGLSASLDLTVVLGVIVKSVLDLMPGVQDAHIYLYRDERLIFGTALWADGRGGDQWSEPRPDGLTYAVARQGETIVVEDMQKHALFANTGWTGTIIGVPLKIALRVVGVMTIAVAEPRAFSNTELRAVHLLAAQAAVAIENAWLYDQVQQLAITDSLTGASNRRGFSQIAERELERAHRSGHPLSLMIFDIDHFKTVNDTFGHPFGDKILCALVDCCRRHIRGFDVIGRWGGEEFVILLPETDVETTRRIAERLRREMARVAVPIENRDIYVTVSIGVAGLSGDIPDLATLVQRADQAMYRAKEAGRNRVEVAE